SPTGCAGESTTRSRRCATPCRGCSRRSVSAELPPPLPPERRTVGQLVAESIRAYGHDFWRCLPLGLPIALAFQAVVYWVTMPLFAGAYLWACRLILDARPTRTAAVVAVLIWLPFPTLRAFYILPGLAWLALVGLAVPAAMVERTGFRDSLVRGRRLGLADYAHALGSICALVVVVGLAANVLGALLHSQGDAGQRVAVFLSELVLSPLLYLGGALLYVDQSARDRAAAARRGRATSVSPSAGDPLVSRGDAGFHPPVDVEPAGRPDTQVEP